MCAACRADSPKREALGSYHLPGASLLLPPVAAGREVSPAWQSARPHRDYLRARAISDTFIDAVCDTEPDGMVFNFVEPTGRVAKQKRLDDPPDPGPLGLAPKPRFSRPCGTPDPRAFSLGPR